MGTSSVVPILGGLAGVINSFALPGGITVERFTSGVDAEGYPIVSGAPTILTFPKALVWQVTGRDLIKLTEGDSTKEVIGVIVPSRLRTAKEGTDEMADVVLYTPEGEAVESRYVVKKAEDWIAQTGHYRCFCFREQTG